MRSIVPYFFPIIVMISSGCEKQSPKTLGEGRCPKYEDYEDFSENYDEYVQHVNNWGGEGEVDAPCVTATLTVIAKLNDVVIIAATNRDLKAMVAEGRFREDLYYRLSVFPILLPPLRERPADILPLADHVLRQASRRFGKRIVGFAGEVPALLRGYAWPGNIRELQNVIERAVILCREERIISAHLHPPLSSPALSPCAPKTLRELEREAILAALVAHAGNRRKAADQLGVGLRTLYTRLREYGISAESDDEK